MADITTSQVWEEIEKQMFAVLGMVTASNEARTVGIVYVAHQRKLYIGSLETAWKVQHIRNNPHVSMTVTIPKRIPFLPWIKIPPATITFSGQAKIFAPEDLSEEIVYALFRGMDTSPKDSPPFQVIEVTPEKDFITYGVGVSLLDMRSQSKAHGRASVRG